MKNLFDSDNYPDVEPEELVSGERWAWKRSEITDAYPTASYTLKYRFSLQKSPFTTFTITASKTNSEHVIEVAQADTVQKTPGEHLWQAVVVRDSDSEEVTVGQGFITLVPEYTGTDDTRSWTYRVLIAIRATIEGTASSDQESYSINGRSLSRRSLEELMALESEFSRKWEAEKAKKNPNVNTRVLVKMSA